MCLCVCVCVCVCVLGLGLDDHRKIKKPLQYMKQVMFHTLETLHNVKQVTLRGLLTIKQSQTRTCYDLVNVVRKLENG